MLQVYRNLTKNGSKLKIFRPKWKLLQIRFIYLIVHRLESCLTFRTFIFCGIVIILKTTQIKLKMSVLPTYFKCAFFCKSYFRIILYHFKLLSLSCVQLFYYVQNPNELNTKIDSLENVFQVDFYFVSLWTGLFLCRHICD